MALGLFLSAFARTEFQAVQFMPAFILPQLLLCGLFVPRDEMAPVLDAISWRAAADLRLRRAGPRHRLGGPRGGLRGRRGRGARLATLAALGLGALTLRRRTP